MDKNSLYKLMEVNGLPQSDLLCHFGFSGASGSIFFNEAHEVSGQNWISGHFLDWPSTEKLDAGKLPGISRVSSGINSSSVDLDGSGYLKGDSVITLGSGIPTGSWTAFLSFKGGVNDNIKDLSNVLLSTNDAPDSTSGFFVGRNSRSLFVENYNNNNSVQQIHSHSTELLEKNIISISKNQLNDISVSVHDFLNTKQVNTETFTLEGYGDSDQINIGGFPNNQNSILGYTGFSGYLDQFVLITGSLAEEQRKDLVDSFYAKNYQKPNYSIQEVQFVAQSGMVPVNGVIDSGITGYENVVVKTMSSNTGTFNLYASSGVTGEITGTFFSGVTGSGIETRKVLTYNEESYSYSQEDIKSYSPSIVSIAEPLAASDVYEIYSRNQKSDTVGLEAEYDKVYKDFTVDEVFTGIEENNQVALIYANGYLLESGNSNTGMYTRVDDYSINASGYSGIDNVIYDLVTTDSNGQVQFEVTSQQATGVRFTGSKYLTKDIYFEGIKLLSGEHWSGGQSNGFVDVLKSGYSSANGVGTGTLIFVPIVDSFTRVTGKGSSLVDTNLRLLNNQVWVNGVRQIEDRDYYTVAQHSQLNSTTRQTPVETILYSGQTGFYNV